MDKISRILLVEDNPGVRDSILRNIRQQDAEVELISVDKEKVKILEPTRGLPLVSGANQQSRSIETSIGEGINELAGGQDVDLIIVDHDLSQLNSFISESAITAAAHSQAIPICRYHRGTSRQKSLASIWELNSSIFAVDIADSPDTDSFAESALEVLLGFKEIKGAYGDIRNDVRKKGAPAVLAGILGRPALVDYFTLYSSGISFLNDPLIVAQSSTSDDEEFRKELDKRIPYVLGYWLHNSILRFPGLILNKQSAASYLNIFIEDFEGEVKSCFDDAKYTGPFATHSEYWWRPDLDDMIDEAGGRDDFLRSRGYHQPVRESVCKESRNTPAGYYDLFSGEAISKECSVGSLAWIPKGADLTRASKEKYEQHSPILNF